MGEAAPGYFRKITPQSWYDWHKFAINHRFTRLVFKVFFYIAIIGGFECPKTLRY